MWRDPRALLIPSILLFGLAGAPAAQSLPEVDKDRIGSIGHSLGGLFALHALVTRPDTFDAYIAISPR